MAIPCCTRSLPCLSPHTTATQQVHLRKHGVRSSNWISGLAGRQGALQLYERLLAPHVLDLRFSGESVSSKAVLMRATDLNSFSASPIVIAISAFLARSIWMDSKLATLKTVSSGKTTRKFSLSFLRQS